MYEITVFRATQDDRVPLARMLELYNHDLSEFWPHDLDSHGEYGYELDRYWQKEAHFPFIARVNGILAGFALVNDEVKVASSGRWMDQFFVVRKYRRSGVGKYMAKQVFAELPGTWEVGQIMSNVPAQAFWRKVIAELSVGSFKEHRLETGPWQGVIQSFVSPPAP